MKSVLMLKVKKRILKDLLKMTKYDNLNIYFKNVIWELIVSNRLDFLIDKLKLKKRNYYSFLLVLDTFCFFIKNKFELNESDLLEYLDNLLIGDEKDIRIFYDYQYFVSNSSGAKLSVIFNKIILNKFQIVLCDLYEKYLIRLNIPNFRNNDKLYNFKYFRNENPDIYFKKYFINNQLHNLDDKEIYLTLKNFLNLLKIQGLNNLYLIKTIKKSNSQIDSDYIEFWNNVLQLASVNKELFNYKVRFK